MPAKTSTSFISALVCLLLLAPSGCSRLSKRQHSAFPLPSSAAEPLRSMKGWELYSWQEDGQWVFAVLMGTNRLKKAEEIKRAKLSGFDALQRTLEQLARGQSVVWVSREAAKRAAQPELAFLETPPKDIVGQVKRWCGDMQLSLGLLSQ